MKVAVVVCTLVMMVLLCAGESVAAVWPGPDGAGYSGATVPYDYTDISATGAQLVLGDDELSPSLPLGFDFTFYGADYSQVFVSSNGFLTFALGNHGCCEGQNIPDPIGPNNLIAGYWTDLDPSLGGTIHYATTGSPGARTFIVQFSNVPLVGDAVTATFQMKLHEGTNEIEMQFQDCSNGASMQIFATGIENSDGTEGLRYQYGDYSLSHLGILISPPAITITTQPFGEEVCSGSNASFTAEASGIPSPSIQWQLSSDDGQTWNDLSGETSGTLTFTASPLHDGNSYRAVFRNANKRISNPAVLNVSALSFGPLNLPGGTAGQPYSLTQLNSSGGIGATTYTVTAGVLPSGMSLASSGLFSGTPMQTGNFPITVTAMDSIGCADSAGAIVPVACPLFSISPVSLPEGTAGTAYSLTQLSASAGVGNVTYAVTTGVLPSGMGLSPSGLLSGTPMQDGSFPLTITATDSNGCTTQGSYVLVIRVVNTTGSVAVPTMNEWGMIVFLLIAGALSIRSLVRKQN